MIKSIVTRVTVASLLTFLFCLTALAQDEKPGAISPYQEGNFDAPFRIEVFNDYQCPGCGDFNKKLKCLKEKYSDRVLIIFRNYPLTFHKNAMLAAKAVEAAGKQGKISEMMNFAYKSRESWGEKDNAEAIFIRQAGKMGMDIEWFKLDLQSQEILDRINFDIERAKSLKLNGTPSVFLNNKEMNFADADNLEEIILQGK